jgi:hypothetical protein
VIELLTVHSQQLIASLGKTGIKLAVRQEIEGKGARL